MKLLSCHIENFGKLHNFHLDFTDGINRINEPNGWGKSTLAAFLKAMLYGFDNRKEEGAFDKERKIYEPWQGGTFGGSLDFMVGEKRYRVVRTFGPTERSDSFQLFDLETNLESLDFTSNLGMELFDLDRASFRKTMYIPQLDCVGGSSDQINAKLGNLSANSNDISNFETAMDLLKDQMNRMSPSRATGSIKKRRNEITALEQELRELEAAGTAAARLREKLEQKEKMLREMTVIRREYAGALQTASEDSRRMELQQTYRSLVNDYEEKNQALDVYRRIFPHGVPTEESFGKCQTALEQLEEQRTTARNMHLKKKEEQELQELGEFFRAGIPSDEALDDMRDKSASLVRLREQEGKTEARLAQLEGAAASLRAEEEAASQIRHSFLPMIGGGLILLGIAALVTGLVAYFGEQLPLTSPFFLVAAVIGLVLLWVGIVFAFTGGSRNRRYQADAEEVHRQLAQKRAERETPIAGLREEKERMNSAIHSAEEDLDFFLHPYTGLDPDDPYQTRLYELRDRKRTYLYLKGKSDIHLEAHQQVDILEKKLRHYAELLNISFDRDMQRSIVRLQKKAAECYMARETAEQAISRRQEFEDSHDMEQVMAPQVCPYTLDELNRMIASTDEGIEHLRENIAQYHRQLADLQDQLDQRDEKEAELAAAKELQQQETDCFDIYSLTRDYLQQAKDRYVSKYMGPITRAFGHYYGILTGESAAAWMIDTNMTLRLKEKGRMRELKWLSAGYRDLLGLCLRMALVRAMYTGEKPFLILDDPFVNLDAEKLENGKRLLKELENEYQMIYFTCHESRK